MTPDEIKSELNAIDQLLKHVNDFVNGLLGNILLHVVPGAEGILQGIHDLVATVSHTIEAIAGSIFNAIGGAIGAIAPTAIDFLNGMVADLASDMHNILGNLASAEEFVSSAINTIKDHAGAFAGFLTGGIGSGLLGALTGLLELMEGEAPQVVDHFLDEALKSIPGDHWLHTMMSGIRGRHGPWVALVLPLLVGVILQPIGEAMVNPFLVELQQEANELFHTQVASAPELVQQHLRGVVQQSQFYEDMAKNNFNAAQADRMMSTAQEPLLPEEVNTLRFRGQINDIDARFEGERRGVDAPHLDWKREAARPILAEDTIRQIFLRGFIDRPTHDALMVQHGYSQDAINRLVSVYYLIPGPQDLIHMGIRNVFDPTLVKQFDLDGNYPDQFGAAAAMQGISSDWAHKYWQAHWIVPGEEFGFRMFTRTTDKSDDLTPNVYTLVDGTKVETIIGIDTLRLFLKDKDVPPYYRDKMAELAYHPLNRIDVRRMYSVGVLSKAGVERAYLDLQYSPAKARQLADFVEAYYSQARKDKSAPIIDGVRRQILRLYQQEKLDTADAKAALLELNFTDAEIANFLADTDLVQQADDAAFFEGAIGRIYTSGFIAEADARNRLTNAKVPQKAIDRLIARWNLTIELNQDTAHFHKARDLTLSQVIEAYKDGIMTRDVASGFVVDLGYQAQVAAILLSEADYRRTKETRTATQAAIKDLFVNGIQDELTTSNALDALGLPSETRDGLIVQWRLLRETRTEKLPIATVRDMLKGDYLSRGDSFDHLKRHRFTDDDANRMLDFWQGVKYKGGVRVG